MFFREVLSQHRDDQEVCVEVLRCWEKLSSYFVSEEDMVEEDLQAARERVLHLIGVLW